MGCVSAVAADGGRGTCRVRSGQNVTKTGTEAAPGEPLSPISQGASLGVSAEPCLPRNSRGSRQERGAGAPWAPEGWQRTAPSVSPAGRPRPACPCPQPRPPAAHCDAGRALACPCGVRSGGAFAARCGVRGAAPHGRRAGGGREDRVPAAQQTRAAQTRGDRGGVHATSGAERLEPPRGQQRVGLLGLLATTCRDRRGDKGLGEERRGGRGPASAVAGFRRTGCGGHVRAAQRCWGPLPGVTPPCVGEGQRCFSCSVASRELGRTCAYVRSRGGGCSAHGGRRDLGAS